MLLVYIASPCRADTKEELDYNLRRARFYARKAGEGGMVPVVPHLMYQGVWDDRTNDWQKLIQYDKDLLQMCEEVWFFPNPDFTQGMRLEADWAERYNKVIRIFTASAPFRKGEPVCRQTN